VTFENLAVVECIKQSLKSHFLATEALIDSVEFIGTTHTHTRLTALCPGLPR